MADPLDITPHASGAETASGSSAAVDIGALRSAVQLVLDVTASAGTTPSLTITVETSVSGSSGWRSVGQFDAAVGTTWQQRTFAECQRYVRLSWTLAGTGGPSFTFTVSGQAHVLYARPSDLIRTALPAAALVNVAAHDQADALLSVTDEAEGYISASHEMPLTAWGNDLRMHVARMGALAVLTQRGLDPSGKDDLLLQGRKDAIDWLKSVAKGEIEPPGMVDQTTEIYEGGAVVVSQPRRRW